jgi:hypothetical protein
MKVRELMNEVMDSMKRDNLLDQELDESRFLEMYFILADGRKITIETHYNSYIDSFNINGTESLEKYF